jgi:hypothetical protein
MGQWDKSSHNRELGITADGTGWDGNVGDGTKAGVETGRAGAARLFLTAKRYRSQGHYATNNSSFSKVLTVDGGVPHDQSEERTTMPVLRNPRHEKFSQLVASGIKAAEAYVSLGYSKAGAPQSANNLLKRTDVRERVNEIQSLAAQSSAEEVAFDQKRVLNRLDVLSRKAEELGQISAAARCEELIW